MPPTLERLLVTPVSALAQTSAATPYDAVVVGGGSAGVAAARTLAEKGRRVALVEAGPLVFLTHVTATGLRFDASLVRQVQTALSYSPTLPDGTNFGALVACVGGRGLFWNGATPKYSETDLRGWPISVVDLEPFYAWIEGDFPVTRNYSSPRLLDEVLRRLNQAKWPAEVCPFAVDTRPTTGGWFGGSIGNAVHPLLRSGLLSDPRKLLQLASGAFAIRILLDGAKAQGVVVREQSTGQDYEVLAKSVVLAAGGFESVKLAIASKLPDPSRLLGTSITDHMFVRAYYPVPDLYQPTVPEAMMAIVRATAERAFQLEIHLPGDNVFSLRSDSAWKPDGSAAYAAMVRSFGPMRPRSANFLEALPADGPGKFVVHLTLDPEDLALRDRMAAALESVRASLGGAPAQAQLMPLGASHHEAGGMIMGTDPARSVTDPWGRVRSVLNVVVVDAATFPAPPATNPHLTIAALARRNATQLHRDL